MRNDDEEQNVKAFYDNVYYKNANSPKDISKYHMRLAKQIKVSKSTKVLDVACGTGGFLLACDSLGASVAGIDISNKAISACMNSIPNGEFYSCSAEQLPFSDNSFDIVTCLGSLEHFLDPLTSLREMIRVASPVGFFLILVPNEDFLTRKLGLFRGTYQVDAKEEVRTLDEWNSLFESAGLVVTERWRDLHILSWSWISSAHWYNIPIRALQAFALTTWPLKWQYQVFHLARNRDKFVRSKLA